MFLLFFDYCLKSQHLPNGYEHRFAFEKSCVVEMISWRAQFVKQQLDRIVAEIDDDLLYQLSGCRRYLSLDS